MNLLSYPSLVEAPFIVVKIGNYTFGNYVNAEHKGASIVNYPNYMKQLQITKINGAINKYTLIMEYQISAGDDPNLLDKVFGTVSNTRKITLSYGDMAVPSFFYKEETAIITKISSVVDFKNSRIQYTINCTSDSLSLMSSKQNFGAKFEKPSTIIYELLYNYKLTDIFTGMLDKDKVDENNLIARDDVAVSLDAKNNISLMDYLNYLVNCMTYTEDKNFENKKKVSRYFLKIIDEVNNDLGGPYFTVERVENQLKNTNSYDTYEIDIGYPGNNFVTNFQLKDDQSWSILYNYAGSIEKENYVYKIGEDGKIYTEDSPSISRSSQHQAYSQAASNWWKNMTEFPVSATLQIKGLIRPTLLMTYIKVNSYFYGRKHSSSGTYIITKQEDLVSSNGYLTTLSLLRIKGDTDEVWDQGISFDYNKIRGSSSNFIDGRQIK